MFDAVAKLLLTAYYKYLLYSSSVILSPLALYLSYKSLFTSSLKNTFVAFLSLLLFNLSKY